MTRIAHEDEIIVYCPRLLDDGPCEAEIVLGFAIEPYYAATRESPAEGGDRHLTTEIPCVCSRLHLFTDAEQVALEAAAEQAIDAYECYDDRY